MTQETYLKRNNFLIAGLNDVNSQNNIHSSFEDEGDDSAFPTNPMELINILRAIEAGKDATPPSDAIDDALKAFEIDSEGEFSFDRDIQ